ncbi:p-hydroxybenzoate 3-monooxygenase [Streptomyces noursei]|nr:p-hydroxybenzoate 3-monooxygenase [Streptomyces noursei]
MPGHVFPSVGSQPCPTSAWTELLHNAGDAAYQGEFRHRIARAELTRLFESGTANRLLSEFIAGLN